MKSDWLSAAAWPARAPASETGPSLAAKAAVLSLTAIEIGLFGWSVYEF